MISSRRLEIFKCVVDDFIKTAEPVGSKTLMEKYQLPYSSATIRNDMMALEELGFLEKTHTSSGRVPSIEGYRYYCQNFMKCDTGQTVEYELLNSFNPSNLNIDDIIKESCDVLSNMINLTAGALGPNASDQSLEHIKLFSIDEKNAVCVLITNTGHTENRSFQFDESISLNDIQVCCDVLNERLKGTKIADVVTKMEMIRPILAEKIQSYEVLFNAFMKAFIKFASEHVYFSGQNRMLYQPEFADIEKLKQLMNMFDNHEGWRNLEIASTKLALDTINGTKLVWLDDVAIISSPFEIDNQQGQLMVVGPPRMDYERIVGLLEYLSLTIEKSYRSR